MDEPGFMLVVLAVVLALVAVLGHGLWSLAAFIVRSMLGRESAGSQAGNVDEVVATMRQLDRLRSDGSIDEPTYQAVMSALAGRSPASIVPPPLPVLAQREGRETHPAAVAEAPAPGEARITSAPTYLPPPDLHIPTIEPLRVEEIPQTPPPPRRPMSAVFSAFMLDSNIRWAELVGGLLAVGCAVALVITFWHQIATMPWWRLGVLAVLASGLFYAGFYTENRWRLPTTSRGVLLVAALLVPLGLLAMYSPRPPAGATGLAICQALLLGWFVFLGERAGRVLVHRWSRLLAAALAAGGLAQIAINALLAAPTPPAPWAVLALGAGTIAAYVLVTGWMLLIARQWRRISHSKLTALFTVLGVSSFAAMLPLALLVMRNEAIPWQDAIQRMAAILSLGGAPALVSGLLLWQRLTDSIFLRERIAGTAIAITGAAIMVGGLALAWPHPGGLLAVALLDELVLSAIAFAFRIPVAHALALPCLALAYLLGLHLVSPGDPAGRLGWTASTQQLLSAFASPATGWGLTGLVALLALGAEALARLRLRRDALAYAIAAACVAAASFLLATYHGFERVADHGAMWVYAFYALLALVAAWRTESPALATVASCLMAVAILQGWIGPFRAGRPTLDAAGWAMLMHAALSIGLAELLARAGEIGQRVLRPPLRSVGFATSILIVLLVALHIQQQGQDAWLSMESAGRMAGVAALWGILAAQERSPHLLALFQLAASATVVMAAGAASHARWGWAWTDLRLLQAQALALATLNLAWILLRLASRRFSGALAPVDAHRPSPEQVLTWILLAGLAVMAAYAAGAGVAIELSPAARFTEIPAERFAELHARSAGAWLLAGMLALVFIAGLWVRFEPGAAVGLMLAATCAVMLAAAAYRPQAATASALRWGLAIFLLAASVPLWLRTAVERSAQRLRWPGFDERRDNVSSELRGLLLVLTILPILALTLYAAGNAMMGVRLVGARPGSWFKEIGNATSYLVPLAAVIVALVIYAARERSADFALAGGAVLALTVSLGHGLRVVTAGLPFDEGQWVRLGEFNAISASLYALAWIGARCWRAPRETLAARAPAELWVQSAFALLAIGLALAAAEWRLVADPEPLPTWAALCGDYWAWAALLLAAAGALWLRWTESREIPAAGLAGVLVAAGSLLACGFGAGESRGWLGYHVLLAARVGAGWLLLGIGAGSSAGAEARAEQAPGPVAGRGAHRLGWPDPARAILPWVLLLAAWAVALSLRAVFVDPRRPWWTICGLGAVAVLLIALSSWTLQRRWLYPAGLLLNVAVSIWAIDQWRWLGPSPPAAFVQVNVLALAGAGLAFLFLELRLLRPGRCEAISSGLPYHHPAALLATLAIALMATLAVLADRVGARLTGSPFLIWTSLGASLALMIACLWDPRARYAVAGLYVLGLSALGRGFVEFDLFGKPGLWQLVLMLAGYAAATTFLYTQRHALARQAALLGIPPRPTWPAPSPRWLTPATLILGGFALLIATALVLGHRSLHVRLAMAGAAAAIAMAVAMLGNEPGRPVLKTLALLIGALATVLLGWAFLHPRSENLLLNRLVVAMVASAGITACFAAGLTKLLRRQNDWTAAARRLVPAMCAATAAALLLLLGLEAALYDPHRIPPGAPISSAGFIAVAAALVALAAAAMVCAIVPGRDPLDLTERGRAAYVYAAELLLVLVFVHTKLCKPDLLNIAIWNRFWPFIVMGLAFTGVGLGEYFRRRGRRVLAEPLENSAAFLPVLPVVAYFLLSGFWRHAEYIDYSTVLALAGLVYGLLSVLRRSFLFGVLAALLGNGALWYLLHRTQHFGFLQHPQMWLAPAGACVLLAAQLNRDRLKPDQLKAIRYFCMMVIYISSTADIFLNGIEAAPWLAGVLAGLAVAGALLGIALRIQSFLFLGILFLLVSLGAMIRYAQLQVHSWWPWLVAGIFTGIAIVVIFALFEHKRTQMTRLVDRLKDWSA